MKTTKPDKHQQTIEYYLYQENNKLCVINYICEYKRRKELIRVNIKGQRTQLILLYAYFHEAKMLTTIAIYVKLFIGKRALI